MGASHGTEGADLVNVLECQLLSSRRERGAGEGPVPEESTRATPMIDTVIEHRHLGVRRRDSTDGRRGDGIERSVGVGAEDAAPSRGSHSRRSGPVPSRTIGPGSRSKSPRRLLTLPAMSVDWAVMP